MTWNIGSLLTFQLEREVFLREQANSLYSPYAYFLAKNAVEVPISIIAPLLQLIIIYWGVGYMNFFQIFIVMLLLCQTGMGVGLLISSMSENV